MTEKTSTSNRSKAFFINGGAGRVLCSIPALEYYHDNSGDEDFLIVCEGGMELYRGHPVLQNHVYEVWHKGLFEEHLRDKDIVSLEPYRINEYFNQECSLAQAFDIEINGKGIRDLPSPTLKLNKAETVTGFQTIQEIKAGLNKDKAVIIQPFGRSVSPMGDFLIDPTSRSFEVQNILNIIDSLREDYAVVVMSELPFPITENPKAPVAVPKEPNLRLWASMIASSDYFLGCDSLGQHLAKATGKSATVVVGSTVPINISYVNDKTFDIIDVGERKNRKYSPIRLTMDDELDRTNDGVMMLTPEEEQEIVKSVKKGAGKGGEFKGKRPTPIQQEQGCCPPTQTPEKAPAVVLEKNDTPKLANYDFSTKNLLSEEK